jgi:CheY-like chemotaxis protein
MEPKRHILLVDDDPFLHNLLSNELAIQGYLVITAENGFSALDSIASAQVDVVLTDIFMPGMDGIELIQKLRARFPGIPIFALSGGADFADPEVYLTFAKALGADEVFAKPVDMTRLAATLEKYCRPGIAKPE